MVEQLGWLEPFSWGINALLLVFLFWFAHRCLGFSLGRIMAGIAREIKSISKMTITIELLNIMAFLVVLFLGLFILILCYFLHLEEVIARHIGDEQGHVYVEGIDPVYLLLILAAVAIASVWGVARAR